ncbi:MAG: ASCH domain-containing protein [Alphaproteobacteria bacterium]|nr:ASCH domain-containing protein [Alphaproteobacteria bacterium]
MVTILLAIKPEFVEKILNGQKKFEFSRRIPSANVDKIIIYATAPVKKVVGVARVREIISMSPNDLWNVTHEFAGIGRDFFDSYFLGRDVGHDYVLENVQKYKVPRELYDFGIRAAPQRFVYMDK